MGLEGVDAPTQFVWHVSQQARQRGNVPAMTRGTSCSICLKSMQWLLLLLTS